MATMYQKKAAMRRGTSDITRLAQQYQQEIAGITGEYEKQYAAYAAEIGQKEEVFNVQKKAYEEKYGAYLGQLSEYNKGMNEYSTAIDEYLKKQAASQEQIVQSIGKIGGDTYFDIGGKKVSTLEVQKNPKQYGFDYVVTPFDAGFSGTGKWIVKPTNPLKEPVAPVAPEKFTEAQPEFPAIGEFDASQFEAKKTQAEQTLKREIGERRAAKLGAVSRKATRPLLGGATP